MIAAYVLVAQLTSQLGKRDGAMFACAVALRRVERDGALDGGLGVELRRK